MKLKVRANGGRCIMFYGVLRSREMRADLRSTALVLNGDQNGVVSIQS